MLEFHTDHKRYFEIQLQNANDYVLPFIEKYFPVKPGMHVLEIGCGQGSLLKAFADRGCECVGVEMYPLWIEKANENLADYISLRKIRVIDRNIYDINPELDLGHLFDLVVLKDVIEHIHDQKRLIAWMKSFLKPGGMVFFGFPPWQMPYGGHQQVLPGILGKTPYWHLLPMPVFKWILKKKGLEQSEMVEIKETGISIERFQRILIQTGYRIIGKQHWMLNPVYQYKFGWKPIRQFSLISSLPFIRNFLTTGVYYIVTPEN